MPSATARIRNVETISLLANKFLHTGINQRIGTASEDDAFLAIWVMKDFKAHREKGFVDVTRQRWNATYCLFFIYKLYFALFFAVFR